jgi:Family of unknown function (DUF6173)
MNYPPREIRSNRNGAGMYSPTETMAFIQEENLASGYCRRILKMIQDFDDKLKENEEVGIKLVSFGGQAVMIHVESLSCWDPSLVCFTGYTSQEGQYTQLIQHVSQISFLLMALPRLKPENPKGKIGFISEN